MRSSIVACVAAAVCDACLRVLSSHCRLYVSTDSDSWGERPFIHRSPSVFADKSHSTLYCTVDTLHFLRFYLASVTHDVGFLFVFHNHNNHNHKINLSRARSQWIKHWIGGATTLTQLVFLRPRAEHFHMHNDISLSYIQLQAHSFEEIESCHFKWYRWQSIAASSVREYVFYVFFFRFQKNMTFYVFFLKWRIKKS